MNKYQFLKLISLTFNLVAISISFLSVNFRSYCDKFDLYTKKEKSDFL